MNRCTIALFSCLMAVFSSQANAAALGTAFTYQGSLNDAGMPVDGLADIRFSLWTAAAAGAPIDGATIEFSAVGPGGPPVNVVAGLFTVDLAFGVTPFDGEDVYLQIEVRVPAGVGAWIPLAPRQRMAPTPYALQTRGLFVNDLLNVGIGTTSPANPLHIESNDTNAVYAHNTATSGTGLLGEAASDFGTGVQGVAHGFHGIGVLGRRTSLDGDDAGVRGETLSQWPGAVGVHGIAVEPGPHGETYGVLGQSNASAGVGVRGESNVGVEGEGLAYGVHGVASNVSTGEGVHGEGTYGVYGIGSVLGAGVVGEAGSSTAVGVLARGLGDEEPAILVQNPGGTGIKVDDGCEKGINTTGSYYALGAVTHNADGVAATLSNTAGGVTLAVYGKSIMSTISPFPEIPDGVLLAVAGPTIISTTSPFPAFPEDVMLGVNGKILAQELEVQLSENWPDFVFADDYPLPGLAQIEAFVDEHGHLPDVPSARDVAENGINIGAMQATLLQKVEELTLHVIELDKKLTGTQHENQMLRARLASIEAR